MLLQINKSDVDDMDSFDDIDVYPPRVFLEARAKHFSCCLVTIKDVQGCTFKLTQPAGDGVYFAGESSSVCGHIIYS